MHTQFYCKTGTAIIILFELVFFPLMVYYLLTIYPVYRVLLPLKKKSRCTVYTINYLTAIYIYLVGWGFLLLVNCFFQLPCICTALLPILQMHILKHEFLCPPRFLLARFLEVVLVSNGHLKFRLTQ